MILTIIFEKRIQDAEGFIRKKENVEHWEYHNECSVYEDWFNYLEPSRTETSVRLEEKEDCFKLELLGCQIGGRRDMKKFIDAVMREYSQFVKSILLEDSVELNYKFVFGGTETHPERTYSLGSAHAGLSVCDDEIDIKITATNLRDAFDLYCRILKVLKQ